MRTVYVRLPNTRVVQRFVSALAGLPGRFDLVSGNYLLDAKSLMSIVSLDLTKPIRLDISEPTPATMQAIEEYIVESTKEED